MRKREELSRGDSCLNKAKEDEFIFVVLDRDLAAPSTVYNWVRERISLGLNVYSDNKIQDALKWAATVRELHYQRAIHRFNNETAAMVPNLPIKSP